MQPPAPDSASDDGERACIIDAAYECLLEPHEGPVPVSAILARAGVSSRAFYRHFDSKDELLLGVLQGLTDTLAGWLDEIADGPGTPVQQLRSWIEQMFALARAPLLNSHLAIIESDEIRSAKGYPEARELARASRERSLIDILRHGLSDGSFPLAEPDGDAVAISALVSRPLAVPSVTDPAAVEEAMARVLGFAMRALGVGRI